MKFKCVKSTTFYNALLFHVIQKRYFLHFSMFLPNNNNIALTWTFLVNAWGVFFSQICKIQYGPHWYLWGTLIWPVGVIFEIETSFLDIEKPLGVRRWKSYALCCHHPRLNFRSEVLVNFLCNFSFHIKHARA